MAQSATASADGPDHLSGRDFQRLSRFIEDYSGIKMPDQADHVEGRCGAVCGPPALQPDAYCDYLFAVADWKRRAISLIDAITTNKTEFFREPDHFRFLREPSCPTCRAEGITHSQGMERGLLHRRRTLQLAMVLAD